MIDITTQEFTDMIMSHMESILPGCHYVLIVAAPPSGGVLQIANVPPEGQKYYLENSLNNMDKCKAEKLTLPAKH